MRFNNGMHWGLGQNNVTYSGLRVQPLILLNVKLTRLQCDHVLMINTITDIVKDVSIQPYVRSRIVGFYGSRIGPNRTVYAYFDGKDVSQYCRMIDAIIYDDMEIERCVSNLSMAVYRLRRMIKGEIRGEFMLSNPPKSSV